MAENDNHLNALHKRCMLNTETRLQKENKRKQGCHAQSRYKDAGWRTSVKIEGPFQGKEELFMWERYLVLHLENVKLITMIFLITEYQNV